MKILFIQTGGTIDKDYPKNTKGYAFEITEPAIQRILAKISLSFEYKIIPLLRKDSLDLTAADRATIYQACVNSDSNKIIITHGTDTMIETAEVLFGMEGKTVVITGAMKPQKFTDSDADFNLGIAIGAINVLPVGIYIAMNGCIFEYDKVVRNESSGKFEKMIERRLRQAQSNDDAD